MSFITRIFKKKSPPAQTDPGDPPDAIDIPKAAPAPIAPPPWPLGIGSPIRISVITPDPPKRRSTRFVNYADADPDLRAEMDKIMAPLAQNPADLATARSLGAVETEHLVDICLYIVGLCAKKDEISTRLLDEKQQAVEPRRVAAVIALNPYVGAMEEAARRYETDYIPAAQKKFADSGDPADAKRLGEIEGVRDEMYDRIGAMNDVRMRAIMVGQMLRSAVDYPEEVTPQSVSEQREGLNALTAKALAAQTASKDAAKASTVLEAPLQVGGPLKLKPRNGPGQP